MFYSFVYKALSQQIEIMTRKLAAGVIFFFLLRKHQRASNETNEQSIFNHLFLPNRTQQRTKRN